jgi:hypothetical protein
MTELLIQQSPLPDRLEVLVQARDTICDAVKEAQSTKYNQTALMFGEGICREIRGTRQLTVFVPQDRVSTQSLTLG